MFSSFEKIEQNALNAAQFGFPLKPISVNAAYIPTTNRATGRSRVVLSAAAVSYKNQIVQLLWMQKRRIDWVTHNRKFRMWVIVNENENIDIDNCHKLIMDAFVEAGVVPDDRNARDTRQMYADFTKCPRMSKTTKFAVMIEWGDELPTKKG